MARGVFPYIVDADEERRDTICQLLADAWPCRVFSSIDAFLDEHPGNRRGCVIVGVDPAARGRHFGLGLSATLQSRQDDLPVILLTNRSDVIGVAEAIRGGAFHCLTMPVTADQLHSCVAEAIEEYDRRRQTREKLLQLRKQMDHMTQRQRHLVGWLCSNLSPQEAAQLGRVNGNGNGYSDADDNGHGRNGNGRGHNGSHWSAFDPDLIDELPRRARQTLNYLLRGDSEKQIATRLKLSRHTVHDYVKLVYKRLMVSSRAELMAKCLGGYVGAEADQVA